MTHVTLTLPYPPSTNRIWRNTSKGTLKSRAYRQWETWALMEIKCQKGQLVSGPVVLTITAGRPDKRRRDISNLIKATEDVLVKARVIEDDCLVESLTARWGTEPGLQVEITSHERER